MNVFQPAGLKATAKLPVLVWIYGGGFVEGASQLNDPTLLVSKSIQMVPVFCCRSTPPTQLTCVTG